MQLGVTVGIAIIMHLGWRDLGVGIFLIALYGVFLAIYCVLIKWGNSRQTNVGLDALFEEE